MSTQKTSKARKVKAEFTVRTRHKGEWREVGDTVTMSSNQFKWLSERKRVKRATKPQPKGDES